MLPSDVRVCGVHGLRGGLTLARERALEGLDGTPEPAQLRGAVVSLSQLADPVDAREE